MLTTVGQKSPVSKWDLKSLLFMQLHVKGRDGGGHFYTKFSLLFGHFLWLLVSLSLFICGFPSSSPPPTSPAVVLSCSSVNV